MPEVDLDFDKSFSLMSWALRINRAHPFIKHDKFWLCQYIVIKIFNVLTGVWLTNSVIFYDIKAQKYTEASKNGIMVIVAITIFLKYLILLRYQNSIRNMINIVNEDYKLSKTFCEEDRNIVIEFVNRGKYVCKIWMISAFATCALFPSKAFILMAYYYHIGDFKPVPMFDFTFPKFIEVYKPHPVGFFGIFMICFVFDLYATSMYIGFDPLVPVFLLHICGQLKLLEERIMKLFTQNLNSDQIKDNLRDIIIKQQSLYRFLDTIKTNFTLLYEFNMKTTTFLLTFTALQIAESLGKKDINIEFIAFFSSVILHFYVPCYYSDLLMEKGEKFRIAVYSCGWETCPDIRIKKMILFMLCRATKPLVIHTVFYAISLDTFAEFLCADVAQRNESSSTDFLQTHVLCAIDVARNAALIENSIAIDGDAVTALMCRQSYGIFNIMSAAWT